MDQWKAAAEQIAVSQTIQGTRLLGIVAPTSASNSSLLAHMIAEAMGRSGLNVLLVGLNFTDVGIPRSAANDPWHMVQRAPSDRIDLLLPNVTAESRDMFNNGAWLAKCFTEQLHQYSNIVIDLPPVMVEREDQLMPLAAASVCNAVILMASVGHVTYGDVEKTVQLLRSAKAPLIGVVVDEGSGGVSLPGIVGSQKGPVENAVILGAKPNRPNQPRLPT